MLQLLPARRRTGGKNVCERDRRGGELLQSAEERLDCRDEEAGQFNEVESRRKGGCSRLVLLLIRQRTNGVEVDGALPAVEEADAETGARQIGGDDAEVDLDVADIAHFTAGGGVEREKRDEVALGEVARDVLRRLETGRQREPEIEHEIVPVEIEADDLDVLVDHQVARVATTDGRRGAVTAAAAPEKSCERVVLVAEVFEIDEQTLHGGPKRADKVFAHEAEEDVETTFHPFEMVRRGGEVGRNERGGGGGELPRRGEDGDLADIDKIVVVTWSIWAKLARRLHQRAQRRQDACRHIGADDLAGESVDYGPDLPAIEHLWKGAEGVLDFVDDEVTAFEVDAEERLVAESRRLRQDIAGVLVKEFNHAADESRQLWNRDGNVGEPAHELQEELADGLKDREEVGRKGSVGRRVRVGHGLPEDHCT